MACKNECTQLDDAMELLIEYGFDGFADCLETLLNTAMKLERSRHLRADPYERNEQRRGYANGYKNKTVQTRVGTLELDIPQTRNTGFYPSSLEKGLRSERALKVALAEMYLRGVSTRKVARITEEMCGFSVSSSAVSRASQILDEQIEAWRNRPLGAYPYVYLDALYEKVRTGGVVTSCAVFVAVGVGEDGRRDVLGTSVALSEHEVHWRDFLRSLKDRGLCGIQLFISDAHEGLKSARTSIFPTVPWQRCQFHLQQNAQQYIPRQRMKKEVAQRIRSIFRATTEKDASAALESFLRDYRELAPDLVQWAEEALPQGLTIHEFPLAHHPKIRTVNMVERINKEIRRRTRVVSIFSTTASCSRLVSAIVMEIAEEWQVGRKYLCFD